MKRVLDETPVYLFGYIGLDHTRLSTLGISVINEVDGLLRGYSLIDGDIIKKTDGIIEGKILKVLSTSILKLDTVLGYPTLVNRKLIKVHLHTGDVSHDCIVYIKK